MSQKIGDEGSILRYWKSVTDEYEKQLQELKSDNTQMENEIITYNSIVEQMCFLFLKLNSEKELENNGFTLLRCRSCGQLVWMCYDEFGFMPEEHAEWCQN
jgi:hypothetical protein